MSNCQRGCKEPEKLRRRMHTASYMPLLICLLAIGLCLSACTRHSLPTNEFKILDSPPSPAADPAAAALQQAEAQCKQQTRHHGIASVFAIFSHLRPGAAKRDYINCMKSKGFDPNAPLPPPGTTAQNLQPPQAVAAAPAAR